MDIDRLKGLAAHLRSIVSTTPLSHGQALDLIAALPGLRNWPEVMAFPDRIAACELDEVSVERLARRLEPVWVRARAASLLYLLEQAEFHAVTPRRNGTERLIVTTSGAGHVKAARIADAVLELNVLDSLVWGPVPTDEDPATFFSARDRAYEEDPDLGFGLVEGFDATSNLAAWEALCAACERHDRVELWPDPRPNDQLHLIRAIVWLGANPALLEKVQLVDLDDPLGERGYKDVRSREVLPRPVGERELGLARMAWDAYRMQTPQAWHALLAHDLDALPYLRSTILATLNELPDVDAGLGATQRAVLSWLVEGPCKVAHLFARSVQDRDASIYRYWDFGRQLVAFARAPLAPITGLPLKPFDMTLHGQPDLHRRFMQSEVTLTPYGADLLAGREDFARANLIDRWWGGTHLTNDNLWRWDDEAKRLAPAEK